MSDEGLTGKIRSMDSQIDRLASGLRRAENEISQVSREMGRIGSNLDMAGQRIGSAIQFNPLCGERVTATGSDRPQSDLRSPCTRPRQADRHTGQNPAPSSSRHHVVSLPRASGRPEPRAIRPCVVLTPQQAGSTADTGQCAPVAADILRRPILGDGPCDFPGNPRQV